MHEASQVFSENKQGVEGTLWKFSKWSSTFPGYSLPFGVCSLFFCLPQLFLDTGGQWLHLSSSDKILTIRWAGIFFINQGKENERKKTINNIKTCIQSMGFWSLDPQRIQQTACWSHKLSLRTYCYSQSQRGNIIKVLPAFLSQVGICYQHVFLDTKG